MRVGSNKKEPNSLQSLGPTGNMSISFTGEKFRFKNNPAAKKEELFARCLSRSHAYIRVCVTSMGLKHYCAYKLHGRRKKKASAQQLLCLNESWFLCSNLWSPFKWFGTEFFRWSMCNSLRTVFHRPFYAFSIPYVIRKKNNVPCISLWAAEIH